MRTDLTAENVMFQVQVRKMEKEVTPFNNNMINRTTLFFSLVSRTDSLCSKRLRDSKFLRIRRPRHLNVKKRRINSEKNKNSIYTVALFVQNANEPSWY